ncbi:ABC transporter ATP-binding protein [Seohaeicola zhoushanensis]|nr:ABC transporter ATP-binding protein [Seohaeicola zhoushanensis]
MLLDVCNLKVHLAVDGKTVRAVDGVDFAVAPGEVVGIVGESGSGKSTLARAIIQLMPNVAIAELSGTIRFNDADLMTASGTVLRRLRRQNGFSMIFQDPLGYLNPTQKVGRQIAEALDNSDDNRVLALLHEVGLPKPHQVARSYPHELSGGMRQRVMIAIALASEPALLFADEPTTSLDATVQRQVLDTLRRLHKSRGMAIAIITHDLGVIAELCDRVYVMRGGKAVESGTVVDVFETPQHPYTAELIRLSTRHLQVAQQGAQRAAP